MRGSERTHGTNAQGRLQRADERGPLKATAVIYDVRTIPPGTTEKVDAIAVALDHLDDYSIVVMIPYRRTPDGQLLMGKVFALKGTRSIFTIR